MARYAQGKYALAVSDISGQSFPWNEMLTQWNGLFVHYSEFESKQPQLNPYPHQADPTALGKVRVQQPAPDALRWLGYNPFQTFAAASGIILVNQADHQRTYGETVRFRGSPTTGGTSGTLADGVFVFANIPMKMELQEPIYVWQQVILLFLENIQVLLQLWLQLLQIQLLQLELL